MSDSDRINIYCTVASLVVTIAIAALQIWQSYRMGRFEKRQDERDEQRHQEGVKAQAVSFISRYYKDRGGGADKISGKWRETAFDHWYFSC